MGRAACGALFAANGFVLQRVQVPRCQMDTYPADQAWRRTVIVLLRLVALVVFLAAVIGLGWAVWDYMITNPLTYRDPEAIRTVTITPMALPLGECAAAEGPVSACSRGGTEASPRGRLTPGY